MKRLLYLFFSLILSSQAVFSQFHSIEVIMNTAVWDTSDVNNKKWVDNFSAVSTYNSNDQLIEEFDYHIDSNNIKSNYRHLTYQYDENNKMIEHNKEEYLNGEWIIRYKLLKTYVKINDKYYLSEATEYYANNTELKPTQKKTYKYLEDGRIDSVFFYDFINDFQLKTVTLYIYDTNKKLIDKIENNNYDGFFEPTLKVSYLYNEKDLLVIESDSSYISNKWEAVQRMLYDYYDNDLLYTTIWQVYFGEDDYRNDYKYIETYFDNGFKDTQFHLIADTTGEFIMATQFKDEYDENWNFVADYYNCWDGSNWNYETKYYIVSTLGVDDRFNYSNSSELFPNPANDFINLKNIMFDKAQIININGNIVKDNILKSSNISLNGLTPGTYFLRTFKAGKTTVTQFIIER